jgi:hypothetical protein
MKKNFLLLFLMALLPLAGWAATLDKANFTAGNIEYGTAVLPTASTTVYNPGDFEQVTTEFYKDDHGEEAIPVANLATTAVGKYYIKVNGAGDYVGQSVYVDFWINGIAVSSLTITVANDPVPTYTGSQLTPAVTVKNGGTTLTLDTDYTLTYGANINAGSGAGSVKITGKGNFSGEKTVTFDIAQKAFTAANITIELGESSFIYNGDQQAPEVTVTDKASGKALAATDYAITYDDNADKPFNAKTGIQIKVTGAGNYTDASIATDAMKYDIAQATLKVTPKASKDYDGTKNLPAGNADKTANFTYQGFQKEEGVSAITLNGGSDIAIATLFTRTGANKDKAGQGTYDIDVDLTKFAATNYKFVKATGTFTIKKKAINVSVENKLNVPYGTKDEDIEYTINATGVTAAETTSIKKATKVTKAATADGEGHYALTLSVNESAATADKAVLDNYDITYGEDAYLTYAKGEIVISLKESEFTLTKEYDGELPSIGELTLDNLDVSGLADGDDISKLVLPTAEIVDASANVGTYQIKLNGATYPGGNYVIAPVSSQYKITQKELKVTISDQTMKVGDVVEDNFNKTAFKVEGLVAKDGTKDDIFELKLATSVVDGEGKIKTGTTTGNHIEFGVKTGKETVAANYILNPATPVGKLVVPAAETIVLDDTEDLSGLTAADNKNVTFTTRQLTKGVWTTMVLPFEATVRQISNALGYAIVDMLEESGDDMNFKIAMGTIPAYTPFLVKVDEDINLNTKVIGPVNIVAPIEANLTQSNDSYNFIGKLDNEAIATDFWAVGNKMSESNFEFDKYKAGKTLKALRAYITAKPGVTAAPKIFIEEPDGTVTAIQAINADGEAVPAEGWYTLSGVKLNAAPTQKGVYIHNGKKFVVK